MLAKSCSVFVSTTDLTSKTLKAMCLDRATGSREALDRAADLALLNSAQLSLIVCLAEFESGDASDQLQDVVISGLRSHFNQIIEPLRAKGLSVPFEIRLGRPFIQVIRHVIAYQHDLVVKSAERSGHQGYRFGSTDLHLLRKCPRPVWLLRRREIEPTGPIVAAVAPMCEDPDDQTLNIKILELAVSLAARHGQAVHVVQGWAPPDPDLLRHLVWPNLEDKGIKDQLGEQRSRTEARFNELIQPFTRKGVALRRHFVDGVASDAIVEIASHFDADVAVMSTLTRATVPGLLIGQTAENVLRRIDCSLLAVKPDDFVSPVAA